MKTNEQIFKEFIAEKNAKALTVEWVNWMLDLLDERHSINPEWLRASHVMLYQATPRSTHNTEPPMIYE